MFLIVSRFEISKKKKIRFFEAAKVDDPLNKLDIWVPHKLNVIQLMKQISVCDSLAETEQNRSIFKANHNGR